MRKIKQKEILIFSRICGMYVTLTTLARALEKICVSVSGMTKEGKVEKHNRESYSENRE